MHIIQTSSSGRRPRLGKVPKAPFTYRGVLWSYGQWQAMIHANGRTQHIGTYSTEEAAARAYDEKAKQLHANSILNFLPDGSLNLDRKYVESRSIRFISLSITSRFLSDRL